MSLERKNRDSLEELNAKIVQLKELGEEYNSDEAKKMPEKERQRMLDFINQTKNEVGKLEKELEKHKIAA